MFVTLPHGSLFTKQIRSYISTTIIQNNNQTNHIHYDDPKLNRKFRMNLLMANRKFIDNEDKSAECLGFV